MRLAHCAARNQQQAVDVEHLLPGLLEQESGLISHIELELTDAAKEYVAREGYDPVYGTTAEAVLATPN
jgi:ATP-dependent Clp protease ATP-binding subunit ClpA